MPRLEGGETAGSLLLMSLRRLLLLLGLRLGHDERLALARQEPLLGVEAEGVHRDGRPLAQQPYDTGQRPQPTRTVPDDHDVRVAERGALAPVLLCGLLPGVEDLRQLTDPGADGLGVGADEDVDVLAARGPGMRQPPHPLPTVLRGLLAEDVELHVHGTVQRGGLGDGPTPHGTGGIPGPRHTDDAQPAQIERDGRVLDLPGDLTLVVVLLGVVEDDLGGELAGPDAEQEMVAVGTAPLPEPGTRPGAEGEHDGRIGNGLPSVVPLGDQRVLGVLLDAGLLLLVLLDLLRVRLTAVLLVVVVVREEQDRAEARHDQVVPALEDQHGDHGTDERRERHQPGQRPGLVLTGRGRQPEAGLPLGGPQSRGPVVVETYAVVGPLEGGVGRGVTGEFEKGVTDGDVSAEGPYVGVGRRGRGFFLSLVLLLLLLLALLLLLLLVLLGVEDVLDGGAVESGGLGVTVDLEPAGAVGGDGEGEGAVVEFGIVDPDDAEPVDVPGDGPADDTELDQPGGLAGQAPRGILEADDGAFAQG